MAGARTPGPLGRDLSDANAPAAPGAGGFGSAGPVGADLGGAVPLDTVPRIVEVKADWSDPPAVATTFTPEISGKTLKDVLTELQKLPEWGTGGGTVDGTGANGEITAEPTDDGKGYRVALKGNFTMTLPKWREYATATAAQKKAWDDMIALLKAHEAEHVAIAFRGARKLAADLKGLPVTLAAQKVADAQTAAQAAQDDFDSTAKTDHGKKDFNNFKKVVLDTSADPPPAPAPSKP